MSAALRRSLASLELPNYRRWFTGMVISVSGNWMQTVAEMWLILKLTNSGTAVGLTAALQFLPMLLVGAWGGLLADRLPKRRLLVVTQTMMAIPALALFALTLSGVVVPWMVFALVLVRGSVLAVDNPARQSFVFELVGSDRVVNAVALNSVLVHASRVVGPAAAGARDRRPGDRPLLPGQRALVRGDDHRPARDGPRRADHAPPRLARARAGQGRPAPRARDAGAGDPARA